MGQRFCGEEALKAAVVRGDIVALYGSACLRYKRGDLLFAVVGTANGLKVIIYEVLGRVERDKISLAQPREVVSPAISKYFANVARKKQERLFTDLEEVDLRRLASSYFPGSFFYDVFLNQYAHMFSSLPPVHERIKPPDLAVGQIPLVVLSTERDNEATYVAGI